MIRDDRDYAAHCDYIHWNPVKHGLAKIPGDWPWSTFHRFVRERFYPKEWGIEPVAFDEGIGQE
jgi:putative transposase